MHDKKKSKLVEFSTEFLGWYGAAAVIIAFGLLNANVIDNQNIWYQILNITGSLGLIIDAFMDKNWQPVALNIVWILIALYGLIQIIL